MKAVVFKEEKQFDGLVLKDVPTPQPGAGEALVRIKAAALNLRDVWIVKGQYPGIKVPVILGADGAGVVSAVGEGVDEKWLNSEVIINPSLNWGNDPRVQQKNYKILGLPVNGTQADFVVVPQSNLLKKPQHLSFGEAAALPLAGLTGYRALFRQGNLQKGETVLITGIGGGVASLMLQMAVAHGAAVVVTSGSEDKIKRAKQLGALGGANYQHPDWNKEIASLLEGRQIDLIVDGAGGAGFNKLLQLVKPAGKIVVYGATAGKPPDLHLYRLFWKQITVQGTTMGNAEDFQNMVRFIELHQLKPVIHKIYPLQDFKAAYLEMNEKKQFGKIVMVTEEK